MLAFSCNYIDKKPNILVS